jgi:hypothetical protein
MALRVVRTVRVEIGDKGVENVPVALEARPAIPSVLGIAVHLEVGMHHLAGGPIPACGSPVLCGGERIGAVDSVYSNNGCVRFTVAVSPSASELAKRWQAGELDAQPLRVVGTDDQEPAGLSYAEMQLLQQFEGANFRPPCRQCFDVAVAIAAEIQARGLKVQPQIELVMHLVGGLTVRLNIGWFTWSQQISIEQFEAEAVPGTQARRVAAFMVDQIVGAHRR